MDLPSGARKIDALPPKRGLSVCRSASEDRGVTWRGVLVATGTCLFEAVVVVPPSGRGSRSVDCWVQEYQGMVLPVVCAGTSGEEGKAGGLGGEVT